MPLATETASPSAEVSPQRCCFCLYPEQGKKDSDKFKAYCDECLTKKYPGCSVYASIPANEYTAEKIREYNCSSPIKVLNNQHGPDPTQVVNVVQVCQSAYPQCSLTVSDTSCSTYEDPKDAEYAKEKIKEALHGAAQVELCGSVSTALTEGCYVHRVIKRFVISPTFTKENLGACPFIGSYCSGYDASKEFDCLAPDGTKDKVKCCGVSDPHGVGYWGKSPDCSGNGCTDTTCPSKVGCKGNSRVGQFCQDPGPKGVCIRVKQVCNQNETCQIIEGVGECVARTAPSITNSLK
jgi:hypothetical protein